MSFNHGQCSGHSFHSCNMPLTSNKLQAAFLCDKQVASCIRLPLFPWSPRASWKVLLPEAEHTPAAAGVRGAHSHLPCTHRLPSLLVAFRAASYPCLLHVKRQRCVQCQANFNSHYITWKAGNQLPHSLHGRCEAQPSSLDIAFLSPSFHVFSFFPSFNIYFQEGIRCDGCGVDCTDTVL